MTRPATLSDIDDDLKVSDPIVAIDFDHIFELPLHIVQKIVELVDELEVADQIVSSGARQEHEIVRYRRKLTNSELGQVLADFRRCWDEDKLEYDAALARPSAVPTWNRSHINAWAEREGFEPVIFPRQESLF